MKISSWQIKLINWWFTMQLFKNSQYTKEILKQVINNSAFLQVLFCKGQLQQSPRATRAYRAAEVLQSCAVIKTNTQAKTLRWFTAKEYCLCYFFFFLVLMMITP